MQVDAVLSTNNCFRGLCNAQFVHNNAFLRDRSRAITELYWYGQLTIWTAAVSGLILCV